MMTSKTSSAAPESYWEIRSRIESSRTCCPQGERVHCVCRISIRCPKHGSICIGTHD